MNVFFLLYSLEDSLTSESSNEDNRKIDKTEYFFKSDESANYTNGYLHNQSLINAFLDSRVALQTFVSQNGGDDIKTEKFNTAINTVKVEVEPNDNLAFDKKQFFESSITGNYNIK